MKNKFQKMISLVGSCLLAVSAGASDDGFVLKSTVWQTSAIPVCWESYSNSTQQQRDWVRLAVQSTWTEAGNVRFYGWQQCQSNSRGVRIGVSDTGPHVKNLGNRIDGQPNGMVLNFTFRNWSTSCQSKVKSCIENIAVHEFGHVLGMAHEQNRPDTPSSCTVHPQGTMGDILVGAWDLNSIMNYCNPKWNGDGKLSTTDKATVRQFYGEKLITTGYDDLPVFSAHYYLKYNTDVAASVGATNYAGARAHWNSSGKNEGRASSPSFSVKEYLALNSDLKAAYGTNYAQAINHFISWGINEGRRSNYVFDPRDYLAINSDLASAFGNDYRKAHNHWMTNGVNEGRASSHGFDVSRYRGRYTDLAANYPAGGFLDLLIHYHKKGRSEGRVGQ